MTSWVRRVFRLPVRKPSLARDGYELPGFRPSAIVRAIPESDHDYLGRLVREAWIKWAKEQPNPKPSWLVPWEELSEGERDVDRRIGVRLANIGRARYLEV